MTSRHQVTCYLLDRFSGGEAEGDGDGEGDGEGASGESDITAARRHSTTEISAPTTDTSHGVASIGGIPAEQNRRHSMIVGTRVLPPSFADKVLSAAAKLKADAAASAAQTTSDKTEGPTGDQPTGERRGSVILSHPTKDRPMSGSKRLPSSASRRGPRVGGSVDMTNLTAEDGGSGGEVSEIEKVLSKRVGELEEKLTQKKEEIAELEKEKDHLKQKLEEKEKELLVQNKGTTAEGVTPVHATPSEGGSVVSDEDLNKLKEEVELVKKERDEVKEKLAEKEKEFLERGEEIDKLKEAKDKLEQMLKDAESKRQQEEDEWKMKFTTAENVEKELRSEMEKKEKERNEAGKDKDVKSDNSEDVTSQLRRIEEELRVSRLHVSEIEAKTKERDEDNLKKATELNDKIQELLVKEKSLLDEVDKSKLEMEQFKLKAISAEENEKKVKDELSTVQERDKEQQQTHNKLSEDIQNQKNEEIAKLKLEMDTLNQNVQIAQDALTVAQNKVLEWENKYVEWEQEKLKLANDKQIIETKLNEDLANVKKEIDEWKIKLADAQIAENKAKEDLSRKNQRLGIRKRSECGG